MSPDQKIRLGILALSAIAAVVVAAHTGHLLPMKHLFLDPIGSGGQGT